MDDLAGLLDGPRAQGAFLLRVVMDPPWGVQVEDRAPLSLIAMAEGRAWAVPESGDPVPMEAGDVAVFRGPDPYRFVDSLDTEPQVVIHPGNRCTTVGGASLAEALSQGVRTWGNADTHGTNVEGRTAFVVGTYEEVSEASRRLLDSLPPLVRLRAGEWDSPLLELLVAEVGKDAPGQDVVLDRLLDLLVVAVLREWLERAELDGAGWYRAHLDPVVGPALRLLQHNPAHAWTVAALAAEVGVSRATLARRFTELVGEPPMAFLTEWRLALAADLLLEPRRTIGAVAHEVGYGSAFALSAAFKRHRGVSPSEHRAAARAHTAQPA